MNVFFWKTFVHKFVAICLQFGYALFKTLDYSNTRKDAEAVSRYPFSP